MEAVESIRSKPLPGGNRPTPAATDKTSLPATARPMVKIGASKEVRWGSILKGPAMKV